MLAPRLVVLAVTGVSLLSFTACSPVGGAAVQVDGTTYTHADVDLFTKFECSYLAAASADPSTGSQVQQISKAQAQSLMASILVTSALDAKVAKHAHVTADDAQVASTMTTLTGPIAKVASGADRTRLTALILTSLRAQIAVQTAIIKQIGEATQQQMGQQQGSQVLQDTIQSVRTTAAKTADIRVDPAYGLSANGLRADSDPSLSVPVSAFAKDSTQTTAPATWLSGLPANQRCS